MNEYSVIYGSKPRIIDCFETAAEALEFAKNVRGRAYNGFGQQIKEIDSMPKKSVGPTRKECMDALCQQCQKFYASGRQDCNNTMCPIYPFMPYGQVQRDLRAKIEPTVKWPWALLNPRAIGYEARKNASADELAKLAEALPEIDQWKFDGGDRPPVVRETYERIVGEPATEVPEAPESSQPLPPLVEGLGW